MEASAGGRVRKREYGVWLYDGRSEEGESDSCRTSKTERVRAMRKRNSSCAFVL